MIRPVFTCLLLCAFCISNQLLAQSFPCGTDFLHQQRLLEPDIYREHTRLKEAASQFFKNNPPNAGKGPTGLSASRVVPVVFHLVHQDGPENLSNAEVQQALAWLNQAFANGGAFDRGSVQRLTVTPFDGEHWEQHAEALRDLSRDEGRDG